MLFSPALDPPDELDPPEAPPAISPSFFTKTAAPSLVAVPLDELEVPLSGEIVYEPVTSNAPPPPMA